MDGLCLHSVLRDSKTEPGYIAGSPGMPTASECLIQKARSADGERIATQLKTFSTPNA